MSRFAGSTLPSPEWQRQLAVPGQPEISAAQCLRLLWRAQRPQGAMKAGHLLEPLCPDGLQNLSIAMRCPPPYENRYPLREEAAQAQQFGPEMGIVGRVDDAEGDGPCPIVLDRRGDFHRRQVRPKICDAPAFRRRY